MVDAQDLRATLERMVETLEGFEEALDIKGKRTRIGEIDLLMADGNFWGSPDKAKVIVEELSTLRKAVTKFAGFHKRVVDTLGMLEMVEDEPDDAILEEIATETAKLEAELRQYEIVTLMSGENEHRSVMISIHAGAGGTEACDWVEMLLRMYMRWLDQHDYQYEQVHMLEGEDAGIKSVTLEVNGFYPYGHLRSEAGVHRLVRISPFDSNARRHTSFASVDVIPLFDEVEVEIDEKDLIVDTFRASGAGGQHVNKTESAVRFTHIPTGIVVQCQSERSQLKNRETGMRELIARVQRYYDAQRDADLKALLGDKGEIAWGHQIRSYVMQPYTLVKDHRTNFEVGDIRRVLDGDLDDFIEAYLRQRLQKATAARDKEKVKAK